MHHELWDTGQLDASLEHLLSQYEASTGTVDGNVPSEIIQGASNIPAEHAKVFSAGPADCVAPEADDLSEDTGQNISNAVSNQSAGIINGGVGDVKAIEIWNGNMENPKKLSFYVKIKI